VAETQEVERARARTLSFQPSTPSGSGERRSEITLTGHKRGKLFDGHGLPVEDVVSQCKGVLTVGGGGHLHPPTRVPVVLCGCGVFVVAVGRMVGMVEGRPPWLRHAVLVLVEYTDAAVLPDPVAHLQGVDPQR